MFGGMINRAFLVLVLLALMAKPVLAIVPEQSPGTVHSLGMRGLVPLPGGVGSHLPGVRKERDKGAAGASEAWRRFVAGTGKKWFVQWNPATGAPELIAGGPLALAGVKELTEENIGAVGIEFVSSHRELLKVHPEYLRLVHAAKGGGRWFVDFRQAYEGVPVLGGQLKMSFTKDNRLIMVCSHVYPDVAVQTQPGVERKKAISLAWADCRGTASSDRVEEAELCILPLMRPKGFDYRLCWKLEVFQPEIHKKWQYLIDAEDGQILSKLNVLVYYDNVTGTAQLEYKPEFASDPVVVGPFSYGNVTARGLEAVLASWNFDVDPGWTAEGQWAFGEPNGQSGYYCADPNSGYTGENVYGYNLQGDYPNDIQAHYLTAPPIDCSGYDNVHLQFMRWLGVESSLWDNASVEVSSDGVNWTTVWANGISRMCDWFWGRVSYDISAVAAFEPSIYIRWVMGPTDESVTYPGWNIDDVEVVSYLGGWNTTESQADGSYVVLPPWHPCAIASELSGRYCSISYGCNSNALFEQKGVEPGQVVDFTWNSDWYNEIVESSVYWHTNLAHDYYVTLDPNLRDASPGFPTGLDYAMPVRVQAGCPYGYCGAYWDSRGMTFGAGNGWYCDDFGLYSDVVYHEYTHAVTSKVYSSVVFPYSMESGALNEAWSDYFACVLCPSQEPLIGEGGLLLENPEGFRTLDNGFRRETDFSNEVHFDSQMLSGPLWEVRQVIGPQVPAELWDEMVHFARYAHPQTFEEYLLALLIEDDIRFGDSEITNGTPHCEAIYTAFGNHGIGGLQYLAAPSIFIDDFGGNDNGKLEPGETVRMSLSLVNGWADATEVCATLETNDPFVTIAKSFADFPDVEYGEAAECALDPFVLSVSADCPETHTIDFTLRPSADGPYHYTRKCLFTYPVAFAQSAFDDGQVDNSYAGYGYPDGGLAVRITPDYYPCRPMQLRLFPKPGEDATSISITVWDDDGPDGLPGTILGSFLTDVRTGGSWFDLDISSLALTIDSGSFYIGWIEGDTNYYNGMDMDPPYYDRSWVYFDIRGHKYWVAFREAGFLANLMLRVRYFYISEDGPVENRTKGRKYDYIQYAIYDADGGDEIVLGPGRYEENISFRGKNLTLRSMDPENPSIVASTIIDGGSRGPAVTFESGADDTCVVTGLTITGGNKNVENDGGISCLDLGQTGPVIRDCVIARNDGPGIYVKNSSPTVVNCSIVENKEDGVRLRSMSYPKVTNCSIARNEDNGISGGYPQVANCTVVRNGQVGVYHSRALVISSIISGNAEAQVDHFAEAMYSNIEGGWPGLGNIDADPCFVAPEIGDYHLKSAAGRWDANQQSWVHDAGTSLCIDAGNPGSPLAIESNHVENVRVNMGAYGGTAQASRTPAGWSLLADLTNDGTVDFVDLGHWAENWLSGGFDWPGDLDRNAIVNMPDCALFARDWLAETIWHE